ncbi:MAG: TolB family protein [Phycisphaerales bacterium]
MRQVLILAALAAPALAQPHAQDAGAPKPAPLDWATLEAPYLTDQTQVTSRAHFVKAGESYFSPDGSWVIFQAVAVPESGAEVDPFYAMYVAPCTLGDLPSFGAAVRVSPAGSANTCGWFHPKHPEIVLLGSTLGRPADEQKSGFQVGTRKYVWMFPSEMEVCSRIVPELAASRGVKVDGANELKPMFSRPNYDAECSYSPDGRYVLYSHVEDRPKDLAADAPYKPDANIYVYDTQKQTHTLLVGAKGYDGGPFWSPDGKRICFRSDRKGNDLLQIYMADVKFNGSGEPEGIEFEYSLTENEHVNWCPFFHPSGEYLVYASSEAGHDNYEVFALDLDPAKLAAARESGSAAVTGLRRARVTHASGADVLPAFTADGQFMIWTSQRGPAIEGEPKPSSQLWIARVNGSPFRGGAELQP